eukprot:SAG22_NODE_1788_length_3571_cov_3.315956_4_plen_102_part_00
MSHLLTYSYVHTGVPTGWSAGQFLWIADDPPQAWTSWNVAKHHNENFARGAPAGGEEVYHNLTFFDWNGEREDFPNSGRTAPHAWNSKGSGTTVRSQLSIA